MNRFFTFLVLAAVLVGQAGALAHEFMAHELLPHDVHELPYELDYLSHADHDNHGEHGTHGGLDDDHAEAEFCELCAGYDRLGSSLTVDQAAYPLFTASLVRFAFEVAEPRSQLINLHPVRGPPAL